MHDMDETMGDTNTPTDCGEDDAKQSTENNVGKQSVENNGSKLSCKVALFAEESRPVCPSFAQFNGGIMVVDGVGASKLLGANEHGLRDGGHVQDGDPEGGENGFSDARDSEKQIHDTCSRRSFVDIQS
ncbi:hypothetical protein SUGI_0260470 [Cryptomeria japonica]|nr:hypothetical protein SUGI_0260470 [Cryptomeria japonica]